MKITQSTANTISTLIEELEEDFPNQLPINSDVSIEEFRRLQGQQEVIQYIRNLVAPEETEEEY